VYRNHQTIASQIGRELENTSCELRGDIPDTSSPVQKWEIQESPADARVTRDGAVILIWPSAAILDFIEPQIAPFDPPNSKTLEANMEWIGCTVCEIFAFKLYGDLETLVRGHSRSSKITLFDRAHMTLYSSSIVTICLYLVPFPRYSRILVENCFPLVFGAPVGGEAVRFTQRPCVAKN